jgi:hypothetical protein
MIQTVALRILPGVVASRASSASAGWAKPGAPPEEVDRDSADRLLKTQTVLPGREGPPPVVDQERHRQWMATRAYPARRAK